MILDELLKVINNDYKVLCNGKEIEKTEKLGEKKFVVEAVSATEGVVYIQVKEETLAVNDLNEKWVQEHIEKHGTPSNIFDGC